MSRPLPVRLPFLARLMDGDEVVDEVPVDETPPEPGRALRVCGRGRRFVAEATWTPAGDDVPHWDVDLSVRLTGTEPVDAGLVVRAAIDPGPDGDPRWLIPGLFYAANRGPGSRAPYPHWTREPAADDAWGSPAWSFRSDRAATPLVLARDGGRLVGLATSEVSAMGITGVGIGPGFLALHAPYREEPVAYDGSPTPRPADRPTHRWRPDEPVSLAFRVYALESNEDPYGIVRDLHGWLSAEAPLAPRVDIVTTADLAAEGLLRWHYRSEPPVLVETVAFERPAPDEHAVVDGDRLAMHVGWLSGAPSAAALLAHGRRTGNGEALAAGRAVLDHIAANLAPCGTFWGQWTADRGWTKGWTPGADALHARTLGEATLFMLRAAASVGARTQQWRRAVASNLDFVIARQRADGAIPGTWNGRTGEPLSWEGSAGLAWVPALVEGARLLGREEWLDAAGRAGAYYARFVDDGLLFGAPEDVDLGPTSEDGYVAVMAYVALAEAPGGPRARWLDLARRAADWTLTFRYAYNVAFDPATTLGRRDFRSRGADQASPANQHLHAYGLVCLPEMVRLARLTGDDHYLERTRENLACFRQLIARHDGDFGARRGMAPERYYQTACFGRKGEIGPLSHAWCLGLLLWASEAALGVPELAT